MGERLRGIALVAVAWLVSAPGLTHACSCGGHDDRFLVGTGALLPANAVGVPWWGTVDSRRGDAEGTPAKSRFSVERTDGVAPRPLDFDVVTLDTEEVHGVGGRWDEVVWLIRPAEGLIPGATYRFRAKTLPWFVPGAMEPGPSDDERRELVVDVSVADEPLDFNSSTTWLRVGPQDLRELTVTTFAGSCSTTARSAVRDVKLELAPAADRFKQALLFSTLSAGEPWRPTSSLCGRLAPGESWTGPGRERIFARCSPGRGNAEPAFGTEPGAHEVEMIAWLPGTSIEFRARATIELTCPGAPADPAQTPDRQPQRMY